MDADAASKAPDARDTQAAAADEELEEELVRFSPEQEASLLAEANAHKTEANALFARGQAEAALTAYEAAVAVLPIYLYYDLAVLRSNMAACHLKLTAWTEAVRAGTQAIDALAKEDKETEKDEKQGHTQNSVVDEDDDVDEVVISVGAALAAKPPLPPQKASGPTPQDRLRIRAKSLLRRARARTELGGWSNLSGAEDDYRALAALPPGTLGDVDRRLVLKQLRELPARTSAAKEKEMGEVMGKLKELGNGLLRPFGISTDNFQMVKDEKTGGYSMNFRQSS